MQAYGIFAVINATPFELTYIIPERLVSKLVVGAACLVPLQGRTCVGLFLAKTEPPTFKCKEIVDIVSIVKPFSPVLLALAHWVGRYYLASTARSMKALAPGFFWDTKILDKRKKNLEKLFVVDADNNLAVGKKYKTSIKGEFVLKESSATVELRPEQQVAIDAILKAKESSTTLLYGVTGSGKTEVYLELAKHFIAQNKTILILVPEISLTPQMTARFRNVFGEAMSVFHSMLTKTEYEREWYRANLGLAKLVLGVRTAVFAPLTNIGLIIVDEEHDGSYKCDESPCYHARDVAIKRATLEKAKCVLGSATPSAESYFNAVNNKYSMVKLEHRHSKNISEVTVIDAKKHLNFAQKAKKTTLLKSSAVKFENQVVADVIIDLIKQNCAASEQSMIILNRRGFANYALCSVCGNALKCPSCAVSTTLHKRSSEEHCHYCGFSCPTRVDCPECGNNKMLAMGTGTQSIEEIICERIPNIRVARLDRDVLTSNSRLSEILSEFRSGNIDCLVGTQLLSKGHDFPKVTLIVVLYVEDGLFLPDFRASERTFQLLTQAAGRAGRGEKPGLVVLQSLIVGHPVIELALEANVVDFLAKDLEMREMAWQPPFSRQILLEFKSTNHATAIAHANNVRELLIEHWKAKNISAKDVRIVGPHPAIIEKIRNVYRFQICITAVKNILPHHLVPEVMLLDPRLAKNYKIDVDPQAFL